ncbi:DNA cytosine methyltransferase, partial [Salmonella enterica subsp. enterica serovar Kisarawe]|nr:DNA cytosine methyltransferase [Salmonella enterica subsp. enterica serovar Kisarawe]
PCQPFSQSGKRRGFNDPRHLWPAWSKLIKECAPHVVFGEQVAGKDGLAWFDAVQLDLEEAEYAVAVVDLCAAGIGAPHIRQRLFWVADANSQCMETPVECGERERIEFANGCSLIGVDYASSERRDAGRNRDYSGYVRFQSGAGRLAHTDNDSRERRLSGWQDSQREVINGSSGCGGTDSRLAYADNARQLFTMSARGDKDMPRQRNKNSETIAGFCGNSGPHAVNNFWRDADWLFCRDGKWRPVEPGLKPLVNGIAGRVGQVRAYGNAIVAPVAETFIRAYMEATQ